MLAKTFFITGTDTDAGKTFALCCLLQAAKKQGLSTAAIKPVAAGGILKNESLHNEDALLLQKNCSLELNYEEINPLCLKQAIAPHIAGMREGVLTNANELAEHCKKIINKKADLTLIEGAGGWQVPLNQTEFIGDIVKVLDIPVILVVGMKLGCLNHALLTVKALQEDGVVLSGWIANQLDPQMPAFDENLDTLRTMIASPLLASIPWSENGELPEIKVDSIF